MALAEELMNDSNLRFTDINGDLVSPVHRYALLMMSFRHDELASCNKCDQISKYKNHINRGTMTHFGTYGKIYGFGYHASFIIDQNKMSISNYASKPNITEDSKYKIKEIEREVKHEMEKVLRSYTDKFYFNVRRSAMLNNAIINRMKILLCDKSKTYTDDILDNMFASFYINVDAGTSRYHTEFDDSYTFIHVPCINSQNIHNVNFQFKISTDMIMNIEMKEGLNFLFSGYMLTHRQNCATKNGFINFSAYTNKRYIDHINKSFARI